MTSFEIMQMQEIEKAPRLVRIALFFVRPAYLEIHGWGYDTLVEYKRFMGGIWFVRANVNVRVNLN